MQGDTNAAKPLATEIEGANLKDLQFLLLRAWKVCAAASVKKHTKNVGLVYRIVSLLVFDTLLLPGQGLQ